MRLGILGGTFDPPHVGHLLAASDAYEALELDRLLFVPAGVQPFKVREVAATPAQRLAMVRLMVDGDPRFAADPIEIDRTGLSFTVDTLTALAARHPGAELFLLIGEDLAAQIASWRDARRIPDLARIVVLERGSPRAASARTAIAEVAAAGAELPMRRLPTRRVDVSSTEIRARVRAGRAIHGYVTERVADYIAATGLYR